MSAPDRPQERAPVPRTMGPLTRTDFVRYQGASGDFYPIHHDEPFALAAGMPAVIGIGMLPAGAMAAWATDWLGPDRLRRISFRWKTPVWPGDVLTIGGAVVREGGGQRELTLFCDNQKGERCAEGSAVFESPNAD